ncbi:protein of unknown function [Rhodovastum atsumiense]|nr:protein of unknown function [Rhodovastum atsumiense]
MIQKTNLGEQVVFFDPIFMLMLGTLAAVGLIAWRDRSAER